ncbi:MAG: sigma 54-interacting transcriptional regulator [Bdellovibrionota bacterium]
MPELQQHILIVDDEPNIRTSLSVVLETAGYKTYACGDITRFFQIMDRYPIDLIFFDIQLEEIDGLRLAQRARNNGYEGLFVFISGHADLEQSAQAIKMGAFDFLQKPVDHQRLLITAQTALATQKNISHIPTRGFDLFSQSHCLQVLKSKALRAAQSDANVFISGESGTGKESLADYMHHHSARSEKPWLKVNCSAFPETLIESELFGYHKGAFTGAHADKIGYFEQADGGMLFLDEIADLSLVAQAKLLRVLESERFKNW